MLLGAKKGGEIARREPLRYGSTQSQQRQHATAPPHKRKEVTEPSLPLEEEPHEPFPTKRRA